MPTIKVEKNPDSTKLQELGVFNWPIWEKEASTFPWAYDSSETCYLLAGEVTVTPENGEAVTFGKGDMVTFPSGMSCTWAISEAVKKHYRFD